MESLQMRYASLLGALLLVLAATAPATAARAPAAPAADAAAQESDCTFPVELTDQSGTTVTVEESPSRVVTLNPSAAQTMWGAGRPGQGRRRDEIRDEPGGRRGED